MKIPVPERGLVIRYSFLWAWEHEKGQEEGSKDRPVVIVNVVPEDGLTWVAVLPITTKDMADEGSRIEIPEATRKRLGLDASASWICFTDLNEFVWPGFDLRLAHPGSGGPDFGPLGHKLFEKVKVQFVEALKKGKVSRVPRE